MPPSGQKRILLADSDALSRVALARTLKLSGYRVDQASTANQIFHLLKLAPVDLLIAEIHLPHTDAIELMRRLRHDYPRLRVIVLTAKGNIDTAVEAVKLGIEDYLLKPLPSRDILAAVDEALHHRVSSAVAPPSYGVTVTPASLPKPTTGALRAGLLYLNRHTQVVFAEHTPHHIISLSRRETILLEALMRHANHVLSFGELAVALWGNGHCFSTEQIVKTLRPTIFRLRKKLEAIVPYPVIITVRQKGYMFRVI